MSWLVNPYMLGAPIEAYGGYVSYYTSGADTYAVHKFTDIGTSTFEVTKGAGEIDYLIVAAGGSGGSGNGSQRGGGGGAGGLLQGTASVSVGSYSVVVGNGISAVNGENSTFNGLTAIGGGKGGNGNSNGSSGGSGGGAGGTATSSFTGGSGTTGQGFRGADRATINNTGVCGGGAGAVGTDNTRVAPLNGLDIAITGTSTHYARGGNGADSTGGSGANGTDGLGYGGDGANTTNTARGGSGVVIIRYKISTSPTYISAYGGDSVQYYTDYGNNSWFIHKFTSTGSQNFVVSNGGYANILIVGAGGGGGSRHGGGGAGGGVVYGIAGITPQTYSVTVGTGGTWTQVDASTGSVGTNGGNSAFGSFIALGGGGGGSYTAAVPTGGGSGGGGGGGVNTTAGLANQADQSPLTGYGFAGGAGGGGNGGGGGGGASATGSAGSGDVGGNGGQGRSISITGTAVVYGSGAGGGGQSGGGTGGTNAGNGGNDSSTAGVANTGGGGGGVRSLTTTARGSNGGSGIVVVRYPAPYVAPSSEIQLFLDSGLEQSYPLSGTTVYDLSGNSRNGSIQGSTSFSNGMLTLNGTTDRVYTTYDGPNSMFADANGSWTAASWFYCPSSRTDKGNGNLANLILGRAGGIGTAATFATFVQTPSQATYGTPNTLAVVVRGAITQISPSTVNDDSWHHVAVTWNGSTCKTYFDGQFVTNATVGTAAVQTGYTLTMGERGAATISSSFCWEGNLSQAIVCNSELSSTSITNIFDTFKSRYGL
jgi:hypothetical protein